MGRGSGTLRRAIVTLRVTVREIRTGYSVRVRGGKFVPDSTEVYDTMDASWRAAKEASYYERDAGDTGWGRDKVHHDEKI